MSIKHGTTNGGASGCPCTACREAINTYQSGYKERVRQEMLAPDDDRHGRPVGYGTYGCRCEACREAQTAYNRKRNSKKVS